MVLQLKPILPTSKFNPVIITASVKRILDDRLKKISTEYALTTQTFEKPVKFVSVAEIKNDIGLLSHTTTDKIYGYINDGTKKRTIRAKPGKFLVFRIGFVPKTVVGRTRAQAGRKFGKLIFTKIVRNHQIKARNFDKRINPKWEAKLGPNIQKAMDKGAKKTGYAK